MKREKHADPILALPNKLQTGLTLTGRHLYYRIVLIRFDYTLFVPEGRHLHSNYAVFLLILETMTYYEVLLLWTLLLPVSLGFMGFKALRPRHLSYIQPCMSLMDDVLTSKSSETSFVFVGGKGGVGKTSTSSAVALAASDSNLKTLIVSTDPAHSLGDALQIPLQSGEIVPVVTEVNLWALEIDVESALDEFKNILSALNSDSIAKSTGIPVDLINSVGLDDVSAIFANPPPGRVRSIHSSLLSLYLTLTLSLTLTRTL